MVEVQDAPVAAPAEEGAGAPPKKKRAAAYTPAQMELTKKENQENSLGYRAIVKKYPGWGLSESGAKDAIARLKKHGTTDRQSGGGRRRSCSTPANIANAQQVVDADPNASKRDLAKTTGLSVAGVTRALRKELNKKSLAQVKVQKIRPTNATKRLEQCQKWKSEMENDWAFDPRKVFWADEKNISRWENSGGQPEFPSVG